MCKKGKPISTHCDMAHCKRPCLPIDHYYFPLIGIKNSEVHSRSRLGLGSGRWRGRERQEKITGNTIKFHNLFLAGELSAPLHTQWGCQLLSLAVILQLISNKEMVPSQNKPAHCLKKVLSRDNVEGFWITLLHTIKASGRGPSNCSLHNSQAL